ncbi:porin [Chitinimonas naiadis]
MKQAQWVIGLLLGSTVFADDGVHLYGRAIAGFQTLNAPARAERAYYPGDTNSSGQSMEINDLYSRWGIKGEETLPNGAKAIFLIESAIALDNTDTRFYVGRNAFASREGWVGLQGDFGTIKLGRGKTPYTLAVEYYDNFIATHTFSSANFGTGYYGLGSNYRSDNTVWYSTPLMSGVQADVTYFSGENKSSSGLNSRGYSAQVLGTLGNFDARFAWQKARDYEAVKGTDLDQYALGGSYTLGSINLGLMHTQNSLRTGGSTEKVKASSLFGTYAFDDRGTALRFGYVHQRAPTQTADIFNVGGQYNLSKRTYGLAEVYWKRIKDGNKLSVATIGVGHDF